MKESINLSQFEAIKRSYTEATLLRFYKHFILRRKVSISVCCEIGRLCNSQKLISTLKDNNHIIKIEEVFIDIDDDDHNKYTEYTICLTEQFRNLINEYFIYKVSKLSAQEINNLILSNESILSDIIFGKNPAYDVFY
jgi:hypothetical protein